MTTTNRMIHETLVARVGVVGMADEGMGTASVTINLDTMSEDEVGRVLAQAFRAAHTDAIRDVGPKLTRAWAEQGDRFTGGDPDTL